MTSGALLLTVVRVSFGIWTRLAVRPAWSEVVDETACSKARADGLATGCWLQNGSLVTSCTVGVGCCDALL